MSQIQIFKYNESYNYKFNNLQEVLNLICTIHSQALVSQGPYSEYRHFVCDPDYFVYARDRFDIYKVCDRFAEILDGETEDLVKFRIVYIPYSPYYNLRSMYCVANYIVNNYNSGGYTACCSICENPQFGYVLQIVVTTVSRTKDEKGFDDETYYLDRAVFGWYKSILNFIKLSQLNTETEEEGESNSSPHSDDQQ